jgi:hypothetical protein
MKQLTLILLIAVVGLCAGMLAGWSNIGYRYFISGEVEQIGKEVRQVMPIARGQDFCYFASVKYFHGEMLHQTKPRITQICVIDENARWVTVPELNWRRE